MSDLVREIEAEIATAVTAAAKQSIGVVREIGDGVARVEGLSDVMLNEMLDFGNGITGLALNLDETEVGVIVLGDYTQLAEGDEVRGTGKLLQVPVGLGLLGRVVNTLGEPIDGKGPIASNVSYPVEKLAPGIIKRQPGRAASADGHHGHRRHDSDWPWPARADHRRSLDRQDDASASTPSSARRGSTGRPRRPATSRTARSIASTSRSGRSSRRSPGCSPCSRRPARCRTRSSLASPASDSATSQYLAPFAGAAMGEWFMDNGMDALIVYDDLSKHAVAYRQVSLVLETPVGPRGVSR